MWDHSRETRGIRRVVRLVGRDMRRIALRKVMRRLENSRISSIPS
jgi:hypothetical protein